MNNVNDPAEREAFETWYCADAARRGVIMPNGIAGLREGDGYTTNAIMLNGKWQGWNARAPWRCFHCDETFTDSDAAAEHFGRSEFQQPACQIDIAEYRKMEEVNRRHCEEDTDLHRTMYAMQSDHQIALRREEEKGYARGLKDAVLYPADAAIAKAQGEQS